MLTCKCSLSISGIDADAEFKGFCRPTSSGSLPTATAPRPILAATATVTTPAPSMSHQFHHHKQHLVLEVRIMIVRHSSYKSELEARGKIGEVESHASFYGRFESTVLVG